MTAIKWRTLQALENLASLQRPLEFITGRHEPVSLISSIVEHHGRSSTLWIRSDEPADARVLEQIFHRGDYAADWFPQMAELSEHATDIVAGGRRPLIIDAGAHIGASCVWFHGRWPQAQILALEPDPANGALLRRNCTSLPVLFLPMGLAHRPCSLRLLNPGQGSWGYRLQSRSSGVTSHSVQAIGMEQLLALDLPEPCSPLLLKVDIEGGEARVFRGPCHWLRQIPLLIIELHDWMLPGQASSLPFLRAMVRHRFELMPHGENLFCFNRALLAGRAGAAP
ncbi:MAG: FkbM family methyltransferase [Prochlorococcaceae cyanobacterium]